jgi:hypothetical protein
VVHAPGAHGVEQRRLGGFVAEPAFSRSAVDRRGRSADDLDWTKPNGDFRVLCKIADRSLVRTTSAFAAAA